tara:strand:- start:282 stop:611 length:330 start_codon:yes stop_codon:yes gene_type:complete
MSLITPSVSGRIPSFRKVGTVLALVNMWMFDGLKVFLIIYSSGVAFMVRICDISFCQRGVTTTVQKHSIPKGRYEERHPATLRGDPTRRENVLGVQEVDASPPLAQRER